MGIELSVGLPMFRAKYIGWLPLESLVRQANINFEWELIVAEELDDETFGEVNIRAYEKLLKKVGCVKIVYKGMNKWIPLSDKWVDISNMCSTDSKIFVIHAADNYSPPLRLLRHYEIFTSKDIHTYIPTKAIYYGIKNGKTILHNTDNYPRKDDCAGRAMDLGIFRKFRKTARTKGVDGWMIRRAIEVLGKGNHRTFFDDKNDNWKYGFSTQGFHNLSDHRDKFFNKPTKPFYECPIDLKDTVPETVLDRLNKCKNTLNAHRKGLPG